MPKMYADRCFQTQRQKKTTKRKNKRQQGKFKERPLNESRNKKQKNQPSRMQLEHMNLWNDQYENQQLLEFQMNRGNQSSESNRLQMINQPKKVAHVGNI